MSDEDWVIVDGNGDEVETKVAEPAVDDNGVKAEASSAEVEESGDKGGHAAKHKPTKAEKWEEQSKKRKESPWAGMKKGGSGHGGR